MEHQDHEREVRDRAAEIAERKHPAAPEQVREGMGTGFDQQRDTPEEELEPNFARGISAEPPGGERHGRFSTGEETDPENPENSVERRFSEGIEESPTST